MQFDLCRWLVGFYDPSFYSSSLVPGGSRRFPEEMGPCEVLSVPFFHHLPSAPTSVSSSFVMAVQGGRGNCWLGRTGPFSPDSCSSFSRFAVYCWKNVSNIYVIVYYNSSRRPKANTRTFVLAIMQAEVLPHETSKCIRQALRNVQPLGVSHFLGSCTLGLDFSLWSWNNNFLCQCCV